MMNKKGLQREMVEMKAAGLSYAGIAKLYGISRQGIQSFFKPKKKTLIEVANRARAVCEICGVWDMFGHFHHLVYEFDILNTPENMKYLCNVCHLKLNGKPHFCKHCGKLLPNHTKRYCSPECRKAHYEEVVECTNCHKLFTLGSDKKIRIRKSQTGWLFCTKQCQGQWLGTHWGRGRGRRKDSLLNW